MGQANGSSTVKWAASDTSLTLMSLCSNSAECMYFSALNTCVCSFTMLQAATSYLTVVSLGGFTYECNA